MVDDGRRTVRNRFHQIFRIVCCLWDVAH
jgi:hypothetical protein